MACINSQLDSNLLDHLQGTAAAYSKSPSCSGHGDQTHGFPSNLNTMDRVALLVSSVFVSIALPEEFYQFGEATTKVARDHVPNYHVVPPFEWLGYQLDMPLPCDSDLLLHLSRSDTFGTPA